MNCKYPNLELIEYKFLQEITEIVPDYKKYYYTDVSAIVFPQTWASTALGFGGFGGSAMTKAYTTVMRLYLYPRSYTTTNTIEHEPEIFGIFFDDRFAYIVNGDHASDEFFDDLNHRNMTSVQVAPQRYRKNEH